MTNTALQPVGLRKSDPEDQARYNEDQALTSVPAIVCIPLGFEGSLSRDERRVSCSRLLDGLPLVWQTVEWCVLFNLAVPMAIKKLFQESGCSSTLHWPVVA